MKGSSLESNYVKQRIKFSVEALAILESCYKRNPYPGISIKKKLSQMFNLDVKKIEQWFCRRRAEERDDSGAEYAYTSLSLHDFQCTLIYLVTDY